MGCGGIVLEARPFAGCPTPFDFWLAGVGCVLVEVDGAQHTRGSMHGVTAAKQAAFDAAKDAAAIAATFHVVRLHVDDRWCWCALVLDACGRARRGDPPTRTLSPAYSRLT
jgi:hypothetical protein